MLLAVVHCFLLFIKLNFFFFSVSPFQRLANAKAHNSRFVSASLPCNKFKNRLVNIMPYESTRVCLQPIRGVEGSDYVNGSFIDGYRYIVISLYLLEKIKQHNYKINHWHINICWWNSPFLKLSFLSHLSLGNRGRILELRGRWQRLLKITGGCFGNIILL